MTLLHDNQLQVLAEQTGKTMPQVARQLMIRLASAETIHPIANKQLKDCIEGCTPISELGAILKSIGISKINSTIFGAFTELTFVEL